MDRSRYLNSCKEPKNSGIFTMLNRLQLRSRYCKCCKPTSEELMLPPSTCLPTTLLSQSGPCRSSLTTWPVVLLHWTPFHSQQLSPPHDDRRFAGSERPALKARRADRSWAVHLLSVSFLWVDASVELLVWVKTSRVMAIWMQEMSSVPIVALLWISLLFFARSDLVWSNITRQDVKN